MTPEALTGYLRSKTIEFLELLKKEYPEIVRDALFAAVCREGAKDFRGALGYNWRECQMLSMAARREIYKSQNPLKIEKFEEAVILWSRLSIEELEKIQLSQGLRQHEPEEAYDLYRLA